MARVHLSGELRRLAGGEELIEVEAATVAELFAAISERYPRLGARLGDGMTVALDGEVTPNADFVPLTPVTEVHFVPSISGG